jgi:alanine dehydrogenase
VRADVALARGVNVVDGTVVYGPVAEAHSLQWQRLDDVIGVDAGA